VAGESVLSFAGLLRQLRAEARLTQEELAQAAGISPRSVSDLERGVTHTAHKDTAVLLAGGLGLAGPAVEMFVAAARGKASPAAALAAAANGEAQQPGLAGSPYQGLSVFEEQDAALFFGRDAATTQVLERMSRLLASVGLLVVSGASGAGKSSLLRAGVLPRIQAGGLAAALGSASWPRVVLTPTRAPLDELALRVGVLAGVDAAAVRRGLDTAPACFALTAWQAALAGPRVPAEDRDGRSAGRDQPPQRRLLLVVDQFEELFTQCTDEGQRRAFITALHAAATAGHGPDQALAALEVLGLRADFEARCASEVATGATNVQEGAENSYIVAHKPALKGAFAADAGSTVFLGPVLAKNGLAGKIPAGGFDLLPGTLAAIKASQLDFTIDQSPYLQGFLPTLYLYLFNLSGGLVAPPNTDTGLTIVTKATVDAYLMPSRFEGSTAAQKMIPRSGSIINPMAT
jgi:transcriptional regulator with XRE-family HTH domain